jgi:hypothetical protein
LLFRICAISSLLHIYTRVGNAESPFSDDEVAPSQLQAVQVNSSRSSTTPGAEVDDWGALDSASDDGDMDHASGSLTTLTASLGLGGDSEAMPASSHSDVTAADAHGNDDQVLVCQFCGETPATTEWFAYKDEVRGEGDIVSTPDGFTCRKHGKTVESFPLLEADEQSSLVHTSKDFNGEFYAAAGNVDKSVNSFMPRNVSTNLEVGRSWEVAVAYASVADYEAHFSCTTSQGAARLTTAYNMRGEAYPAVAMSPDEVPKDLAVVLGSLFIRDYVKLENYYLEPKEQLRNGQGDDTLRFLVMKDEADARGKDLKTENLLNLPSYAQLFDKATKFKRGQKEKQDEMQANFDAARQGIDRAPVVHRSASRFGPAPGHLPPTEEPGVVRHKSGALEQQTLSRSRGRGGSSIGRGGDLSNPKRWRGVHAACGTPTAFRSANPTLPAKAASLVSLTSPAGARKRPLDLPLGALAAQHQGGKYYARKTINLQEIFEGAAPGRQVGPVLGGLNTEYKKIIVCHTTQT